MVCHQAAMVGAGVNAADAPAYGSHNDYATTVLLAGMYAAGISRLVTAASLEHGLRGWEALSGVTTVAAAGIILAGIPTISLWPLAFIIVLDLIVEGAALANVGFALDGRRTKSRN